MKLFTSILLALINIGSLYCQTNIVNKVIKFNLPKRSEILTVATIQRSEIGRSKFSIIARSSTVGQAFEVDSSLVLLNASDSTVRKEHLDELQKGLKEMIRLGNPTFFTSVITEKNNYRVLINNYPFPGENIARYSFYAQGENNKMLVGIIEYKLTNAKNALNTLNELLNGITFK